MSLGYEVKRVAGVEADPSQARELPPAHDPDWRQPEHPGGSRRLGDGAVPAGVMSGVVPSPVSPDPVDEFGQHFLRCFFCRIGDRYTEDHFCETGRELVVAVLDMWVEKERDRFYADEERSLSEMAEWRN